MSNTKISQLPLYSGTAADLRWFVMNNSGETETYKFSGYSSPFLSTGTTNKVIQPVDDKALLQIGSGNTFNDYSGSNLKNALVVGNRNKVDGVADKPVMFIGDDLDSQQFGSYALHIGNGHYASGSYNLSIGDSGLEQNANYSVLIGHGGGTQAHKTWGTDVYNIGQSNQLQGVTGGFAFGKNHTISNGGWNAIFGGSDNSIGSGGNYNAIVGGSNNSFGIGVASTTITAAYNNSNIQAANLSFIAGTQDNTITSMGYTYALVGGGYNTINATNSSAGNAMYSSYFCSDTTINDASVIGNSNNWFSGSRNSNLSGYGKFNHITNTYNSSITNNAGADVGEWFNKIDSSSASTITTSKSSQIIGGKGNTISGKTDVVMVGTSGRTANADYTTYVENLHTYRTPSTQVQPVLSGTVFTCNIDNGAKSQYYITGTSTINITNVRDGASFMIKTQTDGNYVMTWTATGGYTFVFEGGLKDPGNNNTDIFVFEVFGSVIYGNRRHNYS